MDPARTPGWTRPATGDAHARPGGPARPRTAPVVRPHFSKVREVSVEPQLWATLACTPPPPGAPVEAVACSPVPLGFGGGGCVILGVCVEPCVHAVR